MAHSGATILSRLPRKVHRGEIAQITISLGQVGFVVGLGMFQPQPSPTGALLVLTAIQTIIVASFRKGQRDPEIVASVGVSPVVSWRITRSQTGRQILGVRS